MPAIRDDIYNRHSRTWSPGLSNQSMFERIQRAGFDIRDLIRKNHEYDIDAALETADRVSATMIDHGNSYGTRDLETLAARLGSATGSLRQICHQNDETNTADKIPDASEARDGATGSKALISLRESRKHNESSVLPQALAHIMAAQEEKDKHRMQALVAESRGWGRKGRINGTFDSIGSPPEEAVKYLRWLGRGMPLDSIPENMSNVRLSIRNDTHYINGVKIIDKQETTKMTGSTKVLGTAEEREAIEEPEIPRTAEDADNGNQTSDSSSSSSGEEETWPDEAYEATCAQPSSQVKQWSAHQNPNVPRDGYMSYTNGIDKPQYPRPRAYTTTIQALKTISEDSEGETGVEDKRCVSEQLIKDTARNGSSSRPDSDSKYIASVSPGRIGDGVGFKAVDWNSSSKPRSPTMDPASTELDPFSQKKSD